MGLHVCGWVINICKPLSTRCRLELILFIDKLYPIDQMLQFLNKTGFVEYRST